MGIQGNLRTMALPDVLQWLANAGGTGILHIRSPKGLTKKIFFRNGTILSTASSDPREYLGQFLISRGYLTEEQLNMAIETQLQTNIKLGKILIMCGILEEQDLKAMLELKAEECLYDLFLWEDGDFHFEDQDEISDDLVVISLDAMSLIMEGIRRKDEWQRIRASVPSIRAIPGKTELRLKTDSLRPNSIVLRTYEAADGTRSVEDLALDLHATEFEVTSTLFRLSEKGLIRIVGEKEPPEELAQTKFTAKLLREAEKALDEGQYPEAANLYRYAARYLPEDPKVAEGLRLAEEGGLDRFFSETLPMAAKVELAVPMADLMKADLTPQEGYIASRVNGDWDLESIVKVSPLPRAEALKAIRKLYEKGLIRAKNR